MDEKQLAELYPESYDIKEGNELLTIVIYTEGESNG